MAVSYTHLDVYKRQEMGSVTDLGPNPWSDDDEHKLYITEHHHSLNFIFLTA